MFALEIWSLRSGSVAHTPSQAHIYTLTASHRFSLLYTSLYYLRSILVKQLVCTANVMFPLQSTMHLWKQFYICEKGPFIWSVDFFSWCTKKKTQLELDWKRNPVQPCNYLYFALRIWVQWEGLLLVVLSIREALYHCNYCMPGCRWFEFNGGTHNETLIRSN